MSRKKNNGVFDFSLNGRLGKFLARNTSRLQNELDEEFPIEDLELHEDIVIRNFNFNDQPRKSVTKNKNSKKKFVKNTADKKIYSEDSFQKIYGVENLEPYEKIPIVELNFSKRVMNCFKKVGIENLAQLLKFSPQDLISFKNFGDGSYEDTLSILKKFFADNPPAKSLSEEKFDDEIQPSPYLNLIISAFEKFIATTKFRYLPAQIRDKKISPFIEAYNFNHSKPIKNVSPDLTVAEFAEHLPDICGLRDFADWINFDLKSVAEKLLTATFNNHREFEVILGRADNKTLEEIGKNFGLTRERVRQIEFNATKRFKTAYKLSPENIFGCIYAMSNGKKIIIFDDLKNFILEDYAKIFWYFAKKKNCDNKNFSYDEKLKAIVFHGGANLQEIDITEFKNYLPDEIVEENIFLDAVKNFAREKSYPEELLKAKLEIIYKHTGKFFHSIKISGTFKCLYVLKVCFPNGYKIDDETDFNIMIRRIKEFFGDEEDLTQRAVDAKMGLLAVLCGRGKYIHPDFVHVPRKILDAIENFIESSERNVLPFKEIFKALKNKFFGTQITNHHMLQGVIKLYKMPYELRKDYLVKSGGVNIAEEFNAFVKEHGEVTSQEIKREFISFDDHNITFILPRCPEVIQIGNGLFMHSAQLNLQERDFLTIEKFLRRICANNPVNSRQLLDLFYENFFDFLSRNKIDDYEKLFGVLKYMFKGKLNFSRPYIAVEDIKNISNKKILLGYLEDTDAVDIEDLLNICEENRIGYAAISYLIESLRPEFIRVDEFTLRRPESIGITEEIISATCAEVRKSVTLNYGWIAAKNFDGYEWLPQLEIRWTDFLLESVIAIANEKIHIIKIHWTLTNISNAVFVGEDFEDYDYKSFMLKILRDEDAQQPFQSKDEILDWLQRKGLCNKKLPKFLFDEGYIDVNGKIALQ